MSLSMEVGSIADTKTREELLGLIGVNKNEPELHPNSADSILAKWIDKLSEYITDPEWTEVIANTFPYLLSRILRRAWSSKSNCRTKHDVNEIIVLLSKILGRHPSINRFATQVLQEIGSLMKNINGQASRNLPKRARRDLGSKTNLEQLLSSVLLLVNSVHIYKYTISDISPCLHYMTNDDEAIRWLAANFIGCALKLPDSKLARLKEGKISTSQDSRMCLEMQSLIEHVRERKLSNEAQNLHLPLNQILELSSVEMEQLISVGGVLIQFHLPSKSSHGEKLINHVPLCKLPSSVNVLREIALSTLSQSAPICLHGPVGSGKTLLLQYIMSLFGHSKFPHSISVQISDQIDSKLLLGSYHSTDLPGQFVWKPGCLTKAVLNGHWIIFEDLDAATADVWTLLNSLMDNGKLIVPGYGEIQSIHPDFRMFSTCRTQVGKRNDKLKSAWTKLSINHITTEELKWLVDGLFPHFKQIAERLISMYTTVIEFTSESFNSGRLITLRDFMKLCRRVPPKLDFNKPESAIFIFQEACDIFASSWKSQTKKQEIAEVIGTHLNLLKAKAEYFCTTYKPNLSICCNTNSVTCGRHSVKRIQSTSNLMGGKPPPVFSLTKRASCLLEMICGCVKQSEAVLLTGETGVGKTSCVQYLANILHQKLIVVNLNRQSDSADLLGGYKPVELKYVFGPIREEFENLFVQTFNKEANSKFLSHIMTCFANRRWKDLVKLMVHVEKAAIQRVLKDNKEQSNNFLEQWTALSNQLSRVSLQIQQGESPFAFAFIEGSIINAVKNGYWILLDEINLASPEMLQCLYGILDEDSNINLMEKADETPIEKHVNFRLFAAMNPATDVGKKELPLGLRNRFTEFYLPELTDPSELQMLVTEYLRDLSLSSQQTESIVQLYLSVRKLSETALVDGSGKRPHYSLRTLCRALKISSLTLYGSISRSLYESFCLSFLTQLDRASHAIVESIIARDIFGKSDIKSVLNQPMPLPKLGAWVQVEGYWLSRGALDVKETETYILTSSVRRNLKDLARIVSAGKLPVLIQGETSVGKTSLIQYLADLTGNRCYRINNHQHTDLQEYVGSYQSDENGKLVFTEGVLVQAMKRGDWIILDELNLAPSDVLEALNRVLDDNRQLFITETGQLVNAHPRFMLFATQNPPGFYGGRKLLSRAFRNRFVELHFDEIPTTELETILHLRCAIPQSYCAKIIAALKDLQVRRKSSAAFEGKHGFATLRDLFRWAERYRLSGEQTGRFYDWDQHLADEGYLVLAGKVRKQSEAEVIREVLQKHLKRSVDPHNLFTLHEKTSTVTRAILEEVIGTDVPEFGHIVWTFQLRRLAVLIAKALQFKEPILLVGETGCGKTTMVQLLSHLRGQKLFSVSCNMNSEGSDFIGGLRPVREHLENDDRLFEWVDGPLIEAMKNGGIFLADEISLADDSVLERVNSVLEPERTILISEKGDETSSLIKAVDSFHFVGTMNPGGDYGKKELSPALRNRLTEIWCEVTTELEDLESIIEHNLNATLRGQNVGKTLISFVSWLQFTEQSIRWTVTIRDYLSWVAFVNHACANLASISLRSAIHHGACLVLLDGIGSLLNMGENSTLVHGKKIEYLTKLSEMTANYAGDDDVLQPSFRIQNSAECIEIGKFAIVKNLDFSKHSSEEQFTLNARTTSQNGLRLFRAMQLCKPILLEGSPGVGKTALVSVLAKVCGFPLVRINLSEQTDISDLFGADLPVEGKDGGHFEWRDGPVLQALKTSSWILLDELNLASQSVLEGLNACLDHRGEIYVPELNRTFKISRTDSITRIFGCQNPLRQGGARKGLPKSFLNRFTQVYMDALTLDDLRFIMGTIYPEMGKTSIDIMTHFADSVTKAVSELNLFARVGAPWDFNLRDLMRWSELMLAERSHAENVPRSDPGFFVDLIYGQRMRTSKDARRMLQLYLETAKLYNNREDSRVLKCGASGLLLLNNTFICGNGCLKRDSTTPDTEQGDISKQLILLQRQIPSIEALTVCLQRNWMPILVGPSGSGKTSAIKLLAELCGRKLEIMTVSPEMDTMELLGGFEQADVYRKIDELTVGFCEMLLSLVQSIVCHKGHDLDMMDSQVLDLWSSLRALKSLMPDAEFTENQETEETRIKDRVNFLEMSQRKCKSLLGEMKKNQESPCSTADKNAAFMELEQVEVTLRKLSADLVLINTHLKHGIHTGGFQWVDSPLVKAIKSGHWLLIDGANKCSASVLDRLNPLVEPNGTLFLTERGSIDGVIQEIKPHPEFRLILALDPAHGEISRAMRNRGVEIFMPGADDSHYQEDGEEEANDAHMLGRILSVDKQKTFSVWDEVKPQDLNALIRARGLEDTELRRSIIKLHEKICDLIISSLGSAERPTVFQLIKCIDSIHLRIEHGMKFSDAVETALVSFYVRGNSHVSESETVQLQVVDLIRNFASQIQLQASTASRLPLSLPNFVSSQMYRVWKQMNILYRVLESPPTPSLNDQLLRYVDTSTLTEAIIQSMFYNILPQDSVPLSRKIMQELPAYSGLVQNFCGIISSQDYENNSPWDFQWYPHMLARHQNGEASKTKLYSIMKTSLLMNKLQFVRSENSEWNSSSLGTLAKSIAEGKFSELKNTDFFSHFFQLVKQFDQIMSSNLNDCQNSQLPATSFPQLWRRGICTFLWYRRLLNLTNEAWNPLSNRSDRLMSNVTLLIQWMNQFVVTFLQDLSNNASGRQMGALIQNCMVTLDESSGTGKQLSLSEDAKRFHVLCATKPFFVIEEQRARFIEQIMDVCFAMWSLPAKSQDTTFFFYSSEGNQCHVSLCVLCSKMLSGEEFNQEDFTTLVKIKDKLKKSFVAGQDTESPHGQQIETNELKKSLFGLKEYIRIRYSHKNSSFVSPLLVAHNVLDTVSCMKHYFEWEDMERFVETFVFDNNDLADSTRATNSNLFPHLVARIILEDRNGQKSLRISSLGSNNVVKICMDELNSILTERILDVDEESDKMSFSIMRKNFVRLLQKIRETMGEQHWQHDNITQWLKALESDEENEIRQTVLLGSIMIQLGVALMLVSSSLPVVDPAVEKEILTGYIKEEMAYFETWVSAQRIHIFLDNGVDIFACHKNQVHPFLLESVQHLKGLKEQLKETEAGIAQRSNPPQYSTLRHDIQQFTKQYGSPEKMNEIITTLSDLQDSATTKGDTLNSILVTCQTWIDAHKNFCSKLSKQFWYWDIISGYLFASTMVSKGLGLFSNVLSHLKSTTSGSRDSILSLITFPISFRTSTERLQELQNKSLKSELILFLNELETEKYLSPSVIKKLNRFSKQVAQSWRKDQRMKERQKELEDATYIIKGKERTMELSEEEQDALDMKKTFPNYDFEFNDFNEDPNFEKAEEMPSLNSTAETLNPEIISIFLRVYRRAVRMVKNHWIESGAKELIPDFITPFLERFGFVCSQFHESFGWLDKTFNAKFVLGANLVSKLSTMSKENAHEHNRMYDFYHDANAFEAQKLGPIFNSLRSRINELLLEWPEHPSLLKIIEIIHRIEHFGITAPLMKFLTGLELLLGTCQEWESCAHRGVSIAIHLGEITEMIISWRKLELHSWKDLLEVTFIREQQEAQKWWFHLFAVVTEARSHESVQEILKTLQRFIETSTVGQFEVRLDFLYDIHCHIAFMKKNPCWEILIAYTWNIFHFYKQFSPVVASKITSLRSPIEKKLKDFVKISRWNDANFYALKDSVAKSQKTLLKLVKDWKRALQTPVSSFLVTETSDYSDNKSMRHESKGLKVALYLTPANWMDQTKVSKTVTNKLQINRLTKLPKLYCKIQAMAKEQIGKANESFSDVNALNELTGTMIQTVRELEGLQAPGEEVPDKRKKILRNIHFRRRTALADLFKVLQHELNLSYRRGLVTLKNCKNQSDDNTLVYDFSIEPMDITAGWKHLDTFDTPAANKELIEAWNGCETYFQKSIARVALMQKHFDAPSKELSPAIIDRCKGFVGDLVTITTEQRASIAKFSKMLWTLRLLTQQSLRSGVQQKIFVKIYEGVCRIEYVTRQSIILIDSLESSHHADRKRKYNEELSAIIQKCDHVKDLLHGYVNQIVLVHNPAIQDADEILTECLETIDDIRSTFASLEDCSILGELFKEMRTGMDAISMNFMNSVDETNAELSPNQIAKYEKFMNILIRKILLAFQHLRNSPLENSTKRDNDEEYSTDVKRKLGVEISCFDIERVTTIVANVFNIVNSSDEPIYKNVLVGLVPLLKQYAMLAQSYLTLFVSYHRACCKFSSALAGIFGSLAAKGFCLPADYENDAAEEGEEMDSKAGIGLGDGDASSDAKDVSDRIESEDQLEETLKPGDALESADKDLKGDENGIEMSEDFEGKQQDREPNREGDEENSDDDKSDEEQEMDKQMGDLDGDDQNLDEQMWGGSSDEDEDDLNDADNGKGNSSEKSEPELAAKDPSLENQEQPDDEEDKRQKNQPKEINEKLDDEEPDDNQVDPYHGQNDPEPEVEPMELPDELNLDGADPKEMEDMGEEENPFDLDAKENMEVPNLDDAKKDVEKDENQVSDDDESQETPDIEKQNEEIEADVENETDEKTKPEENSVPEEAMDVEEDIEAKADAPTTAKDDVGKNEDDKPEHAPEDTKAPADRAAEPKPSSKESSTESDSKSTEQSMSKNDETASGQAESQDGSGHQGTNVKEKSKSIDEVKKVQDSSKKPGKSDEKRSLIQELDPKEATANRLKTLQESKSMNSEHDTQPAEEQSDAEKNADLYQHIQDAEKSDAVTVDDATKEQAEKSQKAAENEKQAEDRAMDAQDDEEEMPLEGEVENVQSETQEQVQGLSIEMKKKLHMEEKKDEDSTSPMEVDTEGNAVETHGAQRPQTSTIETRFDLIDEWSKQKRAELKETEAKNLEIVRSVLTSTEEIGALNLWRELEGRTLHLAQELCEQLRLVLEPTQASRLKGDYKTGKRLNMRKVIPYIASGFRKDKIWLRRTQPSKREYQILLALDDSASMSDNQSKQMAFSAVAVVAKSLGLLEAGQLGVLSFGEDVQLLHSFDESFSDFSGARLINRFTFAQRRTRIAQLLEASSTLFTHSKQNLSSSISNEVAQLLLIISDGRGVSNEGSEMVKRAVRRIRDQNIFVVFIIVDNPENKDSILDIKLPIFDKNVLVEIAKYMDHFPFPFYIILRDLSALPTVLSDALRQWFELVTSAER